MPRKGKIKMKCIKCGTDLPEGALYCPFCGKKQTTTVQKQGRSRGNGTGSVYRRGKTWTASATVGFKVVDGKSVQVRNTKGGFHTKKEALEALPQLRSIQTRYTPTLTDLWEQYQAAGYKKLSESRQEKYRIAWAKIPELHFTRIDLLTTADLQKAINDHGPTYYTARDIRDLISILYQIAMADQFVSHNLAEFLVLPDKEEKEKEAFTAEEIGMLWEDYASGHWWTGYILLMAYTGMMPGELLGASKSAVDWEGHQIIGAGKKTAVRKATPIVLADIIIPVLHDLCDHTSGEKLIRINKDNFYTQYYETLARAGCRHLRPYACRHTTATALAMENISPSTIQKIMRHAKFTTTEGYIHINMDAMLEAVNRLKGEKL